jgi:large repetitive protein
MIGGHRMKRWLAASVAAVVFGGLIAAQTDAEGLRTARDNSGAGASNVSCGETITADTTLDGDLVDCPGNGIVIAADGVTLDLNGHTIDGDGELVDTCPGDGPCNLGVVNDGHDGVTVRDGSVREFAVGAFVFSARHNRVVDISSSRHDFFGLVVAEAARTVVRDSSLSRNIAPEGDGIGLFGSHDIRIVDNEIRNNPGPGIHVEESTANLIKGNLFSRNGPGLLMERADRNRVRRNRFIPDGVIVAPGNRNVIARNELFRSVDGIAIEKGQGNLVARNEVFRPHGHGIRLGIGNPLIGGANNVVRRNLVRGSGDDAFRVYKRDNQSVLKRNVAFGARDDGFEVRGRSTKLTRNRAVRNGDLGIEAVQGVIDGGGNTAHGNGDPAQCSNIACN